MSVKRIFATKVALLVAAISWYCALPIRVQGQEGDNAVYNSNTLAPSPAFIDATPFFNGDICSTINAIVNSSSYPSAGAVIDARGILPAGSTGGVGGPQLCGSNPFNAVTKPSVVLLPASKLCLTTTWTLPENTRLVGEGPNTILQACQLNTCFSNVNGQALCNSTFSGDMIDMGSSTCNNGSCSGISVEHLQLAGSALNINGIVNNYAQQSSYVDDVEFLNVLGTPLSIGQNAIDSGPYSNLYDICNLTSSPFCTTNNTPCVSIQATTLGLHGITCAAMKNANGAVPPAAILLDASNNSIKDVHIEGFQDGVLIGSRSSATGNVLVNIHGAAGATSGPLKNAVHICNPANATTNCPQGNRSVSDLSFFGIGSGGATGMPASTILDDLTGTQFNYGTGPGYVGMYVLGNKNNSVPGYSRFTVMPGCNLSSNSSTCTGGVPTFAVGSVPPTNGSSCTTPGVVYASTNGTKNSNNTLFLCKGGFWNYVPM